MSATAHHAQTQRRASLTMTVFVVALVVAVALAVWDVAASAMPADLFGQECDAVVEPDCTP